MTFQNSDLLVIGRSGEAYNVVYSEFKTEINNSVLVELQTEKDRAEAAEAALDQKITQESADRIAGDLAEKTRAEAVEAGLSADISQEEADRIAGDLAEKTRAEGVESSLLDAINQESIDRASQDASMSDRITNLKLDDVFDVTVGGVTDNQVLYWNDTSGEWQAKEIVLSSNLTYTGEIDATATAPSANAGDLFVNVATTGSVDASFGTQVQTSLPNGVNGGEFIGFNGNDWAYLGGIGGGLNYDSFTVNNLIETNESKGELSYNPTNGVFSFRKVDLDSRIPKNIGTLPVLPIA